MIYDHSDQAGNTQLTVAESGKMYISPDQNSFIIELNNGETYKELWQQQNASTTKPFLE